MAAVSSITRSTPLTTLATYSSRWYNLSVIVLYGAGIAAIAFVAYRLFFNRAATSSRHLGNSDRPRCIATFYPNCANANHLLPFDNVAAGVFRVNRDDIIPPHLRNENDSIFITCSYENECYFRQPMTLGHNLETPVLEAMVPELPEGKNVAIEIMYRDIVAKIDLHVARKMGIYEIIKEEDDDWSVIPHSHDLPQELVFKKAEGHNFDNPFSLIIHDDSIQFYDEILRPAPREKTSCSLINKGKQVHILFFEVLGRQAPLSASETYALPVVVQPGTTKNLHPDFLTLSWKTTYQAINKKFPPNNTIFEVLSIKDTITEAI